MNGDGKPDLAAANFSSATVSVLLGDGTGSFGTKTDYATGTNPMSVAIGDMNGDGKPDLATVNGGPNTVSVLLGNGAGGFGTNTDFATGTSPRCVAIGDLNGDGTPDVATANLDNTVSVLFGIGTGRFRTRTDFTTGTSPYGVAIGDVNGDGMRDAVTANSGASTVSVFLGNGAGGFGVKTDFATGTGPEYVAIGDVNRDGDLDLVTANYSANTVSVLLGNGTGGFGTKTDFTTGTGPECVAIGDLNLDGNPDLVTANYSANTVSVLLGSGAGGFGTKTDFTTNTGPASVAIGDVNGDGDPDLVTADYGRDEVSVLLGTGTGGFGTKTDCPTGAGPRYVVLGDVNKDGKLDAVTANSVGNTVSVLLGNGTAHFVSKTDFATGTHPNSVAIADLNGDGSLDLVTANQTANTASVLLGNGAGTFWPKTDFATGNGPLSVAIGDLNADGKPDLMTANSSSNSASVLLGPTPTQISLAANPNPAVLAAAVTLTASVSVPSSGIAAPTDSVRFFDGTTLLGTSPVRDGVAGIAFFNSRLGNRALTAAYNGDSEFLGRISAPLTQRVVATAAPGITGIKDVGNDQGRQVRVRLRASPYDYAGSGTPIVRYDVYRRIAGTSGLMEMVPPATDRTKPVPQPVASRSVSPTPVPSTPIHDRPAAGSARVQALLIDGWDLAASLYASADTVYNLVVPTLADSNTSGNHWTKFFVRAATATPGAYFDSPPDSGYSVDNLPPAPPSNFAGYYNDGGSHLSWSANLEPDLWYYRLYRGSSANFVPGPENLIAALSDTNYVDQVVPGSYYKVSAVDVNYNESGDAEVGPLDSSGFPGNGRLGFALAGARPNPSRRGQLQVSFSLPDAAPARLELLDVGGRLLVSRDVGSWGKGWHSIEFSPERDLSSGVYLLRLRRGDEVQVSRVAVLK